MNNIDLKKALKQISFIMDENKDYLIQLDQQNGDGDLGISMSSGFKSIAKLADESDETNLGSLLMSIAMNFNETAPSSLGTILSFGFMGMAKELKGKTDISVAELALALEAGINNIMKKAKSKQGEKTILDSLIPAVEVLKAQCDRDDAFKLSYEAAKAGSEKTKEMKSVHGRAAYYAEKSIGILDGGSVVGLLIFKGLCDYPRCNCE
jgi:dihydroxyacetone kinase-like protein